MTRPVVACSTDGDNEKVNLPVPVRAAILDDHEAVVGVGGLADGREGDAARSGDRGSK
jgi:hypothetical protein